MFASNFQVDKIFNTFDNYWNSFKTITKNYSNDEKTKLFSSNAEKYLEFNNVLKIKDVRAKLYTWKGPIQKIHDNFCTSAADLLNKENISADGMSTFKFLSWLVVEVETEDGHIGLDNAALSPKPCKSVVDNYLKPAIIGESIWDYEHIWQKMYRQTLAWGRKGVGMTAIVLLILLYGMLWVKLQNNLCTVF